MLVNDNRMDVTSLRDDALTEYVDALGTVLDTLAVFGGERGSKHVGMTPRFEAVALLRNEACEEMTRRGLS